MCRKHYVRWYRSRPGGTPCSATGCDTVAYTNGYCAKHWNRVQRHGDPHKTERKHGQQRRLTSRGYALVRRPEHPAQVRGWVHEHRVVMESMIGRLLEPGENVHHRNGVRDDNRPENLELWVSSQPSGQRVEDVVEWAREVLRRYEPLV